MLQTCRIYLTGALLLLASGAAIGNTVESVTLPSGTRVQKLDPNHYRFITPNRIFIIVSNFNSRTTQFDAITIEDRHLKNKPVVFGTKGQMKPAVKTFRKDKKVITPSIKPGIKPDVPFKFPLILTYQIQKTSDPSLYRNLKVHLNIPEKIDVYRQGIFFQLKMENEYYLAYLELGTHHRIVCRQPCLISRDVIQAKYRGMADAIKAVLDYTIIHVLDRMIPVTIHLSQDQICPYVEGQVFAGTSKTEKPENGGGSAICLWWYEKGKATMEHTTGLSENSLFIHEYVEILFKWRTLDTPHWLIYPIQWKLAIGGEYLDGCSQEYNDPNHVAKIFYNLCTDYGFNFDRVPLLLRQIAWMYDNGDGANTTAYYFPVLTTCQIKTLLDEMTGANTCSAFRNYNYGNDNRSVNDCCPKTN